MTSGLDELAARIAETAKGVELGYVTLHVGAGTFQPVRSENLAEHRMHSEWFEVPQATVDAVAAAHAAGVKVRCSAWCAICTVCTTLS